MTPPSSRLGKLAQLTTSACSLCLGLVFGCGNTTENAADEATTHGSTTTHASTTTTTGWTHGSPTSFSSTTLGSTTGGGNDCPLLEPAQGSGCAVSDQVCAYANCTPPEYRDYHELTCVDGAWTLSLTNACQVGPCPAEPPGIGSYCDASLTPGPCSALDACGEVREVACTDWSWQSTDDKLPERPATSGGGGGAPGAPVAPVCPANPPYSGASCCPTAVPERCDTTESGTDGAAGAAGAAFVTSTGGSEDADAPYVLQCAVCTDQMLWAPCPQE